MSNSSEDDTEIPEPRTNPELVGHDEAEAELKDIYDSGRVPHAWLITGPRGIGKATLAYRFARHVLKTSSLAVEDASVAPDAGLFGELPAEPEHDASDGAGQSGLYLSPEDRVFKRVASLGHADLMGIERQWKDDKKRERKTTIAVDDVRKVGGFMRMTPAEGGWRVVVVDAADEMNQNAANALLKVLEEPPSRSLLLLVSHSPGRLLPTIRSRCRKLALRPLDNDTVISLLNRYAPDLPPAEAKVLARLADGSIGRALELAGEGGLDVHADLMGLLGSLPSLDPMRLHKLADKLARKGNEAGFRAAGELLHWTLSRIIKTAATGDIDSAGDVNDNALISKLAGLATLDRWLEVWEKITHLLERADAANLDRKQVILNVFHALGQTATR